MTAPRRDAGHVRIETLDTMHEVMALQELQGAINRDRRRRMPLAAEAAEDIVGADRGVARAAMISSTRRRCGVIRTLRSAQRRSAHAISAARQRS